MPTPAGPAATTPSAPPDDRKIELGLVAVLRGQPSAALTIGLSSVPDDVRLILPFSIIEKQLSTGRVLIPRQTFTDALPETYRNVLAEDSGVTEIQIPLQEVFQNLPGNALSIRNDQVVEEVGNPYPTPFAQKADEDAQRLGVGTPTVSPSVEAATAIPVETAPEAVLETSVPVVEDTAPPEEVPEVADNSFASIFEDTSLDTTSVLPVEVNPASPEEPVTDETTAQAESPRDIPLDLAEPLVEEAPNSSTTPEEPIFATVRDIHPPEEVAVEPPVALEPTPVAEALAVLESTAPMEEAAAPAMIPSAAVPAKAKTPAAAMVDDSELQTLFMTEEDLDAKAVVRHVCQLPGVTGCAVMFADGLRLAGNFPEGDAEGFSAMAPPFFKRSGSFANEALLGALGGITLYTDQGLVSFFMHDDICVSVRHSGRGFQPGVREKLGVVTRELARMYSSEKSADSGHRPS